jgi:MFS family permease
VNIPVAVIALIMIFISRPVTEYAPARMDYRGLVLIGSGVALSVFGFQQAAPWGWSNPATIGCIVIGAIILVVFWFVELRTEEPLIDVKIFHIRPFLVENLVLAVSMLVFVPFFFFASEYAQISLNRSAQNTGVVLLTFFVGFVVAAQIGGRMLDRIGAKRPVVFGCIIAAIGFWLWSGKLTGLDFNSQIWYIVLAGAGMGLMLGQANTDAVNRASRLSYGEATGITQTVRNYAASLGLAILGTLLVNQLHSHVASSLEAKGVPSAQANDQASSIAQSQGGSTATIPHFVRVDFASATQSVVRAMAIFMAIAAVVAIVGLRHGLQEETEAAAVDAPAAN